MTDNMIDKKRACTRRICTRRIYTRGPSTSLFDTFNGFRWRRRNTTRIIKTSTAKVGHSWIFEFRPRSRGEMSTTNLGVPLGAGNRKVLPVIRRPSRFYCGCASRVRYVRLRHVKQVHQRQSRMWAQRQPLCSCVHRPIRHGAQRGQRCGWAALDD